MGTRRIKMQKASSSGRELKTAEKKLLRGGESRDARRLKRVNDDVKRLYLSKLNPLGFRWGKRYDASYICQYARKSSYWTHCRLNRAISTVDEQLRMERNAKASAKARAKWKI
jgi:hypothetical protein